MEKREKKILSACSTIASEELKSRTNVLSHSPAQICTAERLPSSQLFAGLYCIVGLTSQQSIHLSIGSTTESVSEEREDSVRNFKISQQGAFFSFNLNCVPDVFITKPQLHQAVSTSPSFILTSFNTTTLHAINTDSFHANI